jgi:chitinase
LFHSDDKACGEDEEKLAHAYNIRNECLTTDKPKSEIKRRDEYLFGIQVGPGGQNYCCKKDRKAFDKCHWIGSGDCVKNQCAREEVTLATSPYGDVSDTCRCKAPLSPYLLMGILDLYLSQ